jgi:hypothetical protein
VQGQISAIMPSGTCCDRVRHSRNSDGVVKVIDVYPDEVAGDPAMGGYQLMISRHFPRAGLLMQSGASSGRSSLPADRMG